MASESKADYVSRVAADIASGSGMSMPEAKAIARQQWDDEYFNTAQDKYEEITNETLNPERTYACGGAVKKMNKGGAVGRGYGACVRGHKKTKMA